MNLILSIVILVIIISIILTIFHLKVGGNAPYDPLLLKLIRMSNEKYIVSSNQLKSKVILQGFDKFFVSTKSWDSLRVELPELEKYFTSCLLPPISSSIDLPGYNVKELNNFNSNWGSSKSLINLIDDMNKNKIDPIITVGGNAPYDPLLKVGGNAPYDPLLNICNPKVLKDYITFFNKIKQIGIKGIQIDHADAISTEVISLLANNNSSKTPKLIRTICSKQETGVVGGSPLTVVGGLPLTIDNFFGYRQAKKEDEKWRGLDVMIENINRPLDKQDWVGENDYALKFMLNELFNTEDLSINGKVFQKEKMLIGNDKYRYLITTMVDNQDTNSLVSIYDDIAGTPLGATETYINIYRIIPACFMILLLPGIPVIQKNIWDIYKNLGVKDFIKVRNDLGIQSSDEFEIVKSEKNNIGWKVHTDNGSYLIEINEIDDKMLDAPFSHILYSRIVYNSTFYMKVRGLHPLPPPLV